MNKMTYRHELKFLLMHTNYVVIKARIKEILKKDLHVDSDGLYTVRSLYFDDYFNRAYNEKNMSILDRQKYRIRLYNNSDKVINLERKIKSNNYIFKEITSLTRSEAQAILEQDYAFLRKSPSRLKQLFYYESISNVLRPRVMVDYEREPFIMYAGDVRITFDLNIRAGMEALDIFTNKMAMVEVLEANYLIMEVKYTNFLPTIIRDILPAQSGTYSSLSKYVLCCDKTLFKRKTSV